MGLTSFSWYASGFLLALNTFGPQIVVIAAMSVHGDGMRPGSSQHHAKRVSAMFLLIQTLKTWIATCGVALQRRHLMVWALFAPKFVFELCFLAVADLSVLMFE